MGGRGRGGGAGDGELQWYCFDDDLVYSVYCICTRVFAIYICIHV